MEVKGLRCPQCQTDVQFEIISISEYQIDKNNIYGLDFEAICPICLYKFMINSYGLERTNTLIDF